jgi:hypothetical protein
VEELPPLGVVGGHRPDERELDLRHFLADQSERVDNPLRILPGIEARDLADQGSVSVDPELLADECGVLGREGHVLRGQRIDRGRNDLHPTVHARRDVLLHVVDRLVVLAQQRQQAPEGLLVRRREVDVTAPDPVPGVVGGTGAKRCGLGVVDDDHVPVVIEALGVHRVVGLEDLPLLVGDRLRVALERVVHQLGDVEELLPAEDHAPVDVEADVAHERHQGVEDLRDPPAERGRADVQDALALEGCGKVADLLDQPAAGEMGVVGEGPVAEPDILEHGGNIAAGEPGRLRGACARAARCRRRAP